MPSCGAGGRAHETRTKESRPTGETPYKKYRASRLRKGHAGEGLGIAAEAEKLARKEAAGRKPKASGRAADERGNAAAGSAPARKYRAGGAAGPGLDLVPEAEPRARRRWLRWRYLALVILVPLAIVGIVVGIWAWRGYSTFDKAVKKSNRRIDRSTRRALVPDGGSLLRHPTTILVLGTDARGTEPSRSDSIMLMRFNPETHTVAQLSIPRDTLTAIDGHGETKINEAFFWGGAPLAIRTMREFTGMPINHIMIVKFRGFRSLIDSVGGVTVNVPESVTSTYTGGRTVRFKKGPQLMDGETALVYSRIRKSDDDFHRMSRQQLVVQALQKKIAQPGNIRDLPEIGADFMRGVATDLTTNEILALAYLQWRTEPKHRYKWVLEGTPQMINGGSYVVVDPGVKQAAVRRFLSK